MENNTHDYNKFGDNQENTPTCNYNNAIIQEKVDDTLAQNQSEETETEVVKNNHHHKRSNLKRKAKSMLSTVSAGVIGSLVTLVIMPYTDLYPVDSGAADSVAEQSVRVSNQSGLTLQPTSTSSSSIADIVEHASEAVVGIINLQQKNDFFTNTNQSVESGTGSGIIFKKEGESAFVVTNNHVIEGAKEIEVSLQGGEKTKAELIGADALTDLAVLRIDATNVKSVIDFGDSSTLRPGDEVLAIGNPLGLDLSRTVTQGIVSAVNRTISVSTSAGQWDLNVIQTDAAINPGNSGGALINTQGQVVGINSLKISESGVEGLGFAIPSNDLLPIVNEIIETGQVTRPYIGIGLAGLEEIPPTYLPKLPEGVTQGVIITTIDSNSAAAEAGLKVKDVIVAIDGSKVKNSGELRKYLYSNLEAGDKVELEVIRNGKETKIELTLGSNQKYN